MDNTNLNLLYLDDKIDYLYHLGIDTSLNLQEKFGDVSHVIVTRTIEEANIFSQVFAKQVYKIENEDLHLEPLYKTERFHLYKVRNILILSGGVGMPSQLICLNEITKLLKYANVRNPIYLQVGPAGGVNVEPGTIIIGQNVLNNKFEPLYYTIECGDEFSYSTHLNSDLINSLYNYSLNNSNHYKIRYGNIVGAFDFYDEQGRLDGCLPLDYTLDERNRFLQQAQKHDVVGINMESVAFAGFCNQLNIKCAMINYIATDRLISDRVLISKDEQLDTIKNTACFLANYIL